MSILPIARITGLSPCVIITMRFLSFCLGKFEMALAIALMSVVCKKTLDKIILKQIKIYFWKSTSWPRACLEKVCASFE